METVQVPARAAARVTLGEAVQAVLLAKRIANRRPRYLSSLRAYLTAFCRGRESSPIAAVTVYTLEEWFGSRSEAPVTMASNMGRLSALFAYAVRRGWIEANPCLQLERPTIERKAPRILTVEQSHTLLERVRINRPQRLPFFVLALLAGVRPEEIERIDWGCIDLDRGICRVDAAASKVRRRRLVVLPSLAVNLLKLGGVLPARRTFRRRALDYACRCLGLEVWPQDVMRHTAATHLLALHQNAHQVALWLGNSPSILLTHYAELASPEEAKRFFGVP